MRYKIAGGKEESLEDAGAPDGTTFLIRQLFYNTPARRKFLKTAMTEITYDGLTGKQITWGADGEPTKLPTVVVVEGGKYKVLEEN